MLSKSLSIWLKCLTTAATEYVSMWLKPGREEETRKLLRCTESQLYHLLAEDTGILLDLSVPQVSNL